MKQLSQSQIDFLKTLNYGDMVKMRYTFTRNKLQIGYNFARKKLTFTNSEYIILNVERNGFITLGLSNNDFCLQKINPKYIKEV